MKALILAALTAAAPVAALADTLTLTAPGAGGTVHTDTVDMSVYYTRAEDAFEVVAFYTGGTDAPPEKLQMRLDEGDAVVFGLPGHRGTSWSFARSGDALTVASATLRSPLAMN